MCADEEVAADSCAQSYVECRTCIVRVENRTQRDVALEFDFTGGQSSACSGFGRCLFGIALLGREYLLGAVLVLDEQNVRRVYEISRTVEVVPSEIGDALRSNRLYLGGYLLGIFRSDDVLCLST